MDGYIKIDGNGANAPLGNENVDDTTIQEAYAYLEALKKAAGEQSSAEDIAADMPADSIPAEAVVSSVVTPEAIAPETVSEPVVADTFAPEAVIPETVVEEASEAPIVVTGDVEAEEATNTVTEGAEETTSAVAETVEGIEEATIAPAENLSEEANAAPIAASAATVGAAAIAANAVAPTGAVAPPPPPPPPSAAPVFEPAMGPADTKAVDPFAPDAQDAGTIDAYTAIQEGRKKKRRNRIITSLVAAALLLGLIGAGGFWLQGQNPENSDEAPTIPTDVVTFGNYETTVSASGATRPDSSAEVTPEVDGIISEVNVAEGDYVQKGDVLLLIKNDSLDVALTDAKDGVADAQKTVDRAQEGLNKAQNDLSVADANLNSADAHYQTIMGTSFTSQEEADAAGDDAYQAREQAQSSYDAAREAVDNAQSELDSSRKALHKAQETEKEAQEAADKRVVTAPRDGTVISMHAKTGAAVGGATSSDGAGAVSGSLATIGDLTQMRVTVQVNEVDISKIATGQSATVTFSALNDLELPATVERISAVSSGSEGDASMDMGGGIVTYDVDLVIPEPDPRVKPGMTARVVIVTESINDVMMVPESALTDNGDGSYSIYVVNEKDNTSIERMVNVLAQNGSMAAIEGNVAEGDVVQLSNIDMSEETSEDGELEEAVE